MMYEIERDRPIPDAKHAPRAAKYPFRKMEVGDSFAIATAGEAAKVAAAGWQCFRRNRHLKFTVRKDGDSYRCWRIE
jgi:hypothetical protein